MRVSVIVPCRNERQHIQPFLDSFRKQSLTGVELEVVIADGRSTDGTRDVLTTYSRSHEWLKVIDNPGLIASTGLNAAIRCATGEVIVRMDVHSEYAADYIQQCVKVLLETEADNVGGPWVAKRSGGCADLIAAAFESPLCMGGARGHNRGHEGPVDTVYLGCWRRSLFERIGLFDESLVRNQDDEHNFRIRTAGGCVWQSPHINAWYNPRASIMAVFRQYYQYGFWKVPILIRYRRPAAFRHLIPGIFVCIVFALVCATCLGTLVGAYGFARNTVIAFTTLVLCYTTNAIIGALNSKVRDLRCFLMPIVFAAFHFGYGVGWISGVVHWLVLGRGSAGVQKAATELTR